MTDHERLTDDERKAAIDAILRTMFAPQFKYLSTLSDDALLRELRSLGQKKELGRKMATEGIEKIRARRRSAQQKAHGTPEHLAERTKAMQAEANRLRERNPRQSWAWILMKISAQRHISTRTIQKYIKDPRSRAQRSPR